MNRSAPQPRRARMYDWWFVCIGLGFVLLGVRSLLAGQRPLLVTLRFIIAAGFFVLGYGALKTAVSRLLGK